MTPSVTVARSYVFKFQRFRDQIAHRFGVQSHGWDICMNRDGLDVS
jgi:hypothetical protein